jgi:hypothetical protein
MKSFLIACALWAAAGLVQAQSADYRSPLSGYEKNPVAPLDWSKANEAVDRAGGWKAYLRESAQPDQPVTGQPKAAQLQLEDALARALMLAPELRSSLQGIDLKQPDVLRLTEHQRQTLLRYARLTADVKTHYFAAVAARERLAYQQQVVEATSIAAALSQRMARTGNLNAVHQAEAQLAYAEAMKRLMQAQTDQVQTKEALIRLLNLSGPDADFSLSDRLPALPSAPMALGRLERYAVEEAAESGPLMARHPEFLRLRSDARETYLRYRAAFDWAEHYQKEILPLRQKISEEQLLRYNGMIIGVFELLDDARQQAKAVTEYLEALHLFWKAEAALAPALVAATHQLALVERTLWK